MGIGIIADSRQISHPFESRPHSISSISSPWRMNQGHWPVQKCFQKWPPKRFSIWWIVRDEEMKKLFFFEYASPRVGSWEFSKTIRENNFVKFIETFHRIDCLHPGQVFGKVFNYSPFPASTTNRFMKQLLLNSISRRESEIYCNKSK